jgi:hypothetical protein
MLRSTVSAPHLLASALACALACAVHGCAISRQVGSDCGDEALCDEAALIAVTGGPGSGPTGSMPIANGPKRDGFVRKLDLLFVVNDSRAAQAQHMVLAQAIPDFIAALASGDLDGGGEPSFRGVQDLHLGVISGRMGVGIAPASCAQSFGSEGELTIGGCLGVNARFASSQSSGTLAGAADALACMVKLGAAGCFPPQPLESALKALWPSEPALGRSGIVFADGSRGGPPENMGFVRPDSLLVVIVVSDVDDCSVIDTAPLKDLDPGALLHRCSVRPEVRAEIGHYERGLRSLRPGAEDLVMFFALAGVPPDSVSAAVLEETSFDVEAEREAFYAQLLGLPAFQSDALDDRGTESALDDIPRSVCTTTGGPIYPARRLVELSRAFGANGLVQSLCASDLGPALRAVLRSIGRRLGPPAL